MASGTNRGLHKATLLGGASLFALATYWPELTGLTPGPADNFVSGIFQFIGGLTALAGGRETYRGWLLNEQRLAAAQTTGTYGEAAFATADECDAAGLFDPHGLYLGLLEDHPIFYQGKAHLLTCAPARQGKGIGFVIPNLLHYQGSVVVTDPKGELAAVTAQHRAERFGQSVAVFNPWGLHGLPQHRINPLENTITLAGDPALQRGLTDEVTALVMQLYPEPEDSRNRFFREGARSIMRAALLYLALERPQLCTLTEMWRIIASPQRLQRTVEKMRELDALGGIIADLGDDLAHQMADNADLFGDFRAGALQQLSIFEPGSYLGEAVSANDIALADLKSGSVSLYLAFPPERILSHGAALGLIVNQAIQSVSRSSERGEVLFMLDEFANLGKLSGLAESLTALPGLGVRVWMIVQELAEIVRIYGPHTARTISSQAEVKQFFAVGSDELAQTLTRALGQRTVITKSHNLGRLDTDEIGESIGETGQPLMRAEEIVQMGPNEQLLLVKSVRPIFGQRLPFWFIAPWREWATENPVEGGYPNVPPLLRLAYTEQETTDADSTERASS